MARPSTFRRFLLLPVVLMFALPSAARAQGTRADYERSDSLAARLSGLVVNEAEAPSWIGSSDTFWYRKSVQGGDRFVLVDATTGAKSEPFDHDRLASALTTARGEQVSAVTLPFRSFRYAEEERAIEFTLADSTWRCGLADYRCENRGAVQRPERPEQPFPWSAGPGQLWRFKDNTPIKSPDGKWEAFIQNFNVAVRDVASGDTTMLSWDGSEGNMYTHASLVWSPDSRRLAVYRVIPGYQREVHYVLSSPEDQLQPKTASLLYAKPGDVLDRQVPVVFDVTAARQVNVDESLFPNEYDVSELVWRKDGRHLTFEYNQRGHQVYRIIEIDAETGATRSVVSEEPKTFFFYSGKKFRYDIDDGREIIWMSERDGWNHLYLYDGATGKVKNQITKGEWVVRGVDSVDVAKRQIWFRASGMNPDQDPYFIHYYRVDFDGTGLTAYTSANGMHSVSFSPDHVYYVDRWSRVDLPPVMQLRRTSDRSVIADLEHADASALLATGWSYPEVIHAKGRDGKTDIWGILIKPTDFDPSRKYPVIENIYAGPHGSFVPKTFSTQLRDEQLAELGFIVAHIDGMGTSNRSKAFQDVAWKNLKDGGFPDRILWHQAVAAKYPWYDISRVGIFGTSAGGQNSMAAMLFHPEFYKVAVSSAGCHDNRMDKIWWNELWMGWPIGPQYSASSNVDNAWRLQGKLLLTVGEYDTNVDPSSTIQVVNALIKANKDFDFLYVPGADHGNGGRYGVHKRNDFFVENLLGVRPPDWNHTSTTEEGSE